MSRGDRREPIFQDYRDREGFLAALKALGWTEKELPRRAKGDQGRVRLARQSRAETTMTLGWIVKGSVLEL